MLSTDFLLVNYVVCCCVNDGTNLPNSLHAEQAHGIIRDAMMATAFESSFMDGEDDEDDE